MPAKHHTKQAPAESTVPYVMKLPGTEAIAITLRADWTTREGGEIALLPPAVRFLDRIRALFTQQPTLTPALIRTLRESLDLTQDEFAAKLRVTKMTVSRWERGTMKPNDTAGRAILNLRKESLRRGVRVNGYRK